MNYVVGTLVIAIVFFAIGAWWRCRSLACPASLSWLLENPYMKAVAGPEKLFQRLHLEEGMKVLDVGPGPGRLTLPTAVRVGNTGEVVAMDIQQRMLWKLEARAEALGVDNIRLINAGAGSGKTDKDYFNRALLVTVLGEIPNKHEALVEIYQALKTGGILSVTEVIPDPHYTKKEKVRALCEDVGFKEVESFGNWMAFTINFMKTV